VARGGNAVARRAATGTRIAAAEVLFGFACQWSYTRPTLDVIMVRSVVASACAISGTLQGFQASNKLPFSAMEELPSRIQLVDRRSGEQCEAELVELTRKLAASEIDGRWWKLSGKLLGRPADEGDHHWVWRKLVGEHRNDLAWHFLGCQTTDAEIQGAAGYRIDFCSVLAPGEGSVYVDRIAVAPRNRRWLVETPLYAGVGDGLMLRVVCHSYILGLGGRVSLVSLPSERPRRFYERRGFTRVSEDDDGMVEYELEEEAARRWLQQAEYLT
jgi:hypothetical protein